MSDLQALFDLLGRPGPHDGPWFHVSPNEIAVGDALIPGGPDEATSQSFYDMIDGDHRAEWIWVSTSLADAHFWAACLGAPHIYEVEPGDEPEPWGLGADGWVCLGAKIIRKV